MLSSVVDGMPGGQRHSFASVNSAHSTTILSNSNGSLLSNNNNSRSCNLSGSGNSNYANYNFANYYDDPRNPFDTQKIPEEDEDNVSSSAMEDCSLSGRTNNSYLQQHQQQYLQPTGAGFRRTNSQRSHSTMSSSSNRHHSSFTSQQQQQHRHQQFSSSFREEEEDDDITSMTSSQTSSMRNKDGAYTSHLVSQLESQVAKLNFELATTKSSLDQLQLENRKLHDEKSEWHKTTRLMQEENDQLRHKIEQMERDKLMRTMEGTKGVARGGRTSMDVGSCVVWGGSSVSGNTWADTNNRGGDANTIATYRKEMRQNTVERLEVPFNTTFSEPEDRHTYTRPRRPSTASTGSYRSYADDDYKSVGSVGSVNLDYSGSPQESDEQIKTLRSSMGSSFLGTLKPMQKLQEMSRQIEEKVSLTSIQRRNDDESTLSNSMTNTIESALADAADAAAGDNNKLGHIEEEYDDDDPFATWSENRERLSSKKKWYQRGDGQKPQSQHIDAEEEQFTRGNNNEERIEDPFDTAKGENNESEYTSFAKVGNCYDDGRGEDDVGSSVTQQPKRGGFRLPWQRGNDGR